MGLPSATSSRSATNSMYCAGGRGERGGVGLFGRRQAGAGRQQGVQPHQLGLREAASYLIEQGSQGTGRSMGQQAQQLTPCMLAVTQLPANCAMHTPHPHACTLHPCMTLRSCVLFSLRPCLLPRAHACIQPQCPITGPGSDPSHLRHEPAVHADEVDRQGVAHKLALNVHSLWGEGSGEQGER